MVWKSKDKVHLEEQWVPRERIKTKTEFVNCGLQGSVSNSREHVKLDKPVDVGSSGECLGFESRPNYVARPSSEKEDFEYSLVFEVGSYSKDCGPHGLDVGGFKLKESGHLVKGLTDQEKNSLELLGTDAPALELKSTALELRSMASSLVVWVVVNVVCRSSRLGHADIPLKVRFRFRFWFQFRFFLVFSSKERGSWPGCWGWLVEL